MAIECPNSRPFVTVHDAITGKTVVREANDDDLTVLEALGWTVAPESTPEPEQEAPQE